MTYTKNHWSKYLATAAIVLAGFGLQACGDDDSGPTPSDKDSGASGSGGSNGKKDAGGGGGDGGSNGSDAGADSGASGSGGSNGGSDGGTDSGTTDGGGDCTGTDGCYSCEPTTNDQVLNHCTEATCQGYDNSTLTELLPDGKLPDLPK